MLNGKLSLHDIDDVEAFCIYLINRQRRGGYAGHDYEDLLAWFIERVWRLSLRYDSERESTFSHYAATSIRAADWERLRFGRTRWVFKHVVYERPRPVFVPLDDRPDLADPRGAVDASADSVQALLGLQ